jgi:hypothetical protein
MEFGLPMGEVLKETSSRFENHNPFWKRDDRWKGDRALNQRQ